MSLTSEAYHAFSLLSSALSRRRLRWNTIRRTDRFNRVAPLAPPASDRLDPQVVPTAYHIQLKVDPSNERYSGQVAIDMKLLSPRNIVWLHSHGHELTAIRFEVDGRPIEGVTPIRGEPDWLAIQLPEKVMADEARLTLSFTGRMNHKLVGMYRVRHADDWYIYTQFEAIDARKTFPCFDEPRFKTPFSMVYTVPTGLRVFSNAPKTQQVETSPGGCSIRLQQRHHCPLTWWQPPLVPLMLLKKRVLI